MFIVIEGIDGTGKSTLAKALTEALGTEVTVLTREPTDSSVWGKRLRAAAEEGRLSPEEELDYFHRDRLHHLETLIRPALAAGKHVICDRYIDSTLAYQAKDPEEAEHMYARFAPDLLTPDLVFILECPVELAFERIGAGRDGRSQFEVRETLERAAAIYASLKGDRYHRVDASREPKAVLVDVVRIVEKKLAN